MGGMVKNESTSSETSEMPVATVDVIQIGFDEDSLNVTDIWTAPDLSFPRSFPHSGVSGGPNAKVAIAAGGVPMSPVVELYSEEDFKTHKTLLMSSNRSVYSLLALRYYHSFELGLTSAS